MRRGEIGGVVEVLRGDGVEAGLAPGQVRGDVLEGRRAAIVFVREAEYRMKTDLRYGSPTSARTVLRT